MDDKHAVRKLWLWKYAFSVRIGIYYNQSFFCYIINLDNLEIMFRHSPATLFFLPVITRISTNSALNKLFVFLT